MLTILEQDALTTDALHEPSGSSDARLVDAARRGDQAAYGELVQRYEQRLCRVIYRFTRDLETSEVMQNRAVGLGSKFGTGTLSGGRFC